MANLNSSNQIEQLLDELNISENKVKIEFVFKGMRFWISKTGGMIRRRVPAMGYLKALGEDKPGIYSNKYDQVISQHMTGVKFEGEDIEADMMTKNATRAEFVRCGPRVLAEVPDDLLEKVKKQEGCQRDGLLDVNTLLTFVQRMFCGTG